MENRMQKYVQNGPDDGQENSSDSRPGQSRLDSNPARSESVTKFVSDRTREIVRERPVAVVVGGLLVGLAIGWLTKR